MTTTLIEPRQTGSASPVGDSRFDLAASLVGFQGLLFLVTAVEAGFMAAVSGNAAGAGPVAGSLAMAALSLIARSWLRKKRGRRVVRLIEWSMLAWAGIDLALALWLTGNVLPMVSVLSRVGLPVWVLVLTRKNYL